ncbi:Uu.00g125640.m01.CDS01 [Anthostomella pinea]|uniref:Uu.00g125640.m01.CDS01 n=1 Tax=Anthostomella pinea TaxID=933095 RepID=A0AAI8VIR8_9PEZI|nr:Uu.00g125640.m01.CDS01 [Anthostomella pinea]
MPSSSSSHRHHHHSSSSQQSSTWQDRLEEACREYQIHPPDYQLVSDRRGGRTAWSSRVTVYGKCIDARFWYDGKNLNNAKEDAAEVALNWLASNSNLSSGW